MTPAHKDAFEWLKKHGGDGVFAEKNHQVLLAQGERAPFMRSTWNALVAAGKCEFYGKRRIRVVVQA